MSNLSFISKLIENIVAKQLNNYLNRDEFSNVNQCTYIRLHSTETALHKSQNDISASMDKLVMLSKAVVLTFLDLSAAFDIVDHNIVFNLPQGLVWG